jgi:catechol 2,3-dioxygenase-like lactoylglutathione lyase family enzyme
MEMAETTSKTRITEVGTVMVPVSDQDKAIEFYVDKLGFEKRSDTPFGEGNRWVEVAPAGAETVIALVQPREQDPIGIELAFGLNTTDIEADHAELKAKGVDVDEEITRMPDPVPPMLMLRDQDGNTLMVVERTE